MRVFRLFVWSAALAGICGANEPEKYAAWADPGVNYDQTQLSKHACWVTGDVINDTQQGLMFRADKPVEGNTTGNLVSLAVSEELAKTFAPMCYRAAERHRKLRLHGAFLPHSGRNASDRPSVFFVFWGIHMPEEPDKLPPDKTTYVRPGDAIPGYTIIPKEP
jgi:hypothetical protein